MKRCARWCPAVLWVCSWIGGAAGWAGVEPGPGQEVNRRAPADEGTVHAILGGRLVDGRGGPAIEDAAVVIVGDRIVAAGPRAEVEVPDGADRFDASGLTVMPGLVDAHFHSINDNALLGRFLRRGVTSVRDPGHPFRFYQSLHFAEGPMPRVFLTGAHLDGYPPVWPQQAVVVRDAAHARETVQRHADRGASGIKVYYRLPLEHIEAACEAARERGVPVTGHLELVDADAAIRAGLGGIEHVTSFGTALAEAEAAERFKAAVRDEDGARGAERYKLWAGLDLESERVGEVIGLAAERGVVFAPTLAVFERRASDDGSDEDAVRGFENMLRFVGMCHEAGLTIVAGSHTWVPHADLGWAMQRELELLIEAGLTPGEAIAAGTMANARYFGAEDRLGSVEPGKLADLLLIEGDPTENIAAMYDVRRVMLHGRWVEAAP